MRTAAAAIGLPLAGSAHAAGGKGGGTVFAKMDASGDGVVTGQEFQAFAQDRRGKKGHAKATPAAAY